MEHRIRAAGILIEDEKILMVKVKDHTGVYWIPPGGGMEAGDASTKDTLRREFLEETNLHVEVGNLLCVREFQERHPPRYHAEFFYLIDSYKGEPSKENLLGLNDQEYIQDVEWVRLETIKNLRVYPAELKNTLIEDALNQRFSAHLGSYVQGENESKNWL
ncbi:NUDIX domain-containing protein [Vibrio sp. S9_S30]|uniref:NUDIX domain-containing protein n=1 Tax=Vibrio sp. S9_S30 TaxID=2720226 RepID=UPI00168086AA|nr:NUDIX domain-containing protein [Vibrio sp. S9_S30]MBD1559294.1 NUDIX domain-containing protein [Vibrio sp. S9_S30]